MWAKIITIKRTKDLNYFSLCALNLFNTRVSQFELNYWNKWTFPPHTNLLRCTCISFKDFKYITQGQFNCLSICIMLNRIQNWCSLHFCPANAMLYHWATGTSRALHHVTWCGTADVISTALEQKSWSRSSLAQAAAQNTRSAGPRAERGKESSRKRERKQQKEYRVSADVSWSLSRLIFSGGWSEALKAAVLTR